MMNGIMNLKFKGNVLKNRHK